MSEDFGFTFESSDDIDKKVLASDDKARAMYDAIKPLLDNLKQNPEKDLIRWPGRHAQVAKFEEKLLLILNGFK